MNDEIKEIIERLKRIDHKEYIAFEFADNATFDEMARCFEERKKMADCITNLQQAIKDTKDTADDMLFELQQENETRQQDINNLTYQLAKTKEENERLKELIDADNESYDIQETIINRQKSELLEQEDYKSRVEKAVEYINNYCIDDEFYVNLSNKEKAIIEVLNILQKGEKI